VTRSDDERLTLDIHTADGQGLEIALDNGAYDVLPANPSFWRYLSRVGRFALAFPVKDPELLQASSLTHSCRWLISKGATGAIEAAAPVWVQTAAFSRVTRASY
jgi:hypothetical protein